MDDPGDRVGRLWSSLTPPAPIVVAIVLSFVLAAPLIFFPAGAARYELDSLAFGIGLFLGKEAKSLGLCPKPRQGI